MGMQVENKDIKNRQVLKVAKIKALCECTSILAEELARIEGLKPVVFTDVDGTQRRKKNPVSPENSQAIEWFKKEGGLLAAITGALLSHVPKILRGPFTFGESGGVLSFSNGRIVDLAPKEEVDAIWELQRLLGIEAQEGFVSIEGKLVFMEGPRRVSLTLLVKPHLNGARQRNDRLMQIEELEDKIFGLIADCELPLFAATGVAEDESCAWIDVTTSFRKENAVRCFMEVTGKNVYYIADGLNDVDAILLNGVTGVAVGNSIPAIKDASQILIERDGPDGGAADALYAIMGRS